MVALREQALVVGAQPLKSENKIIEGIFGVNLKVLYTHTKKFRVDKV